jgi:hypothetical protein
MTVPTRLDFSSESSLSRDLKVVRLYSEYPSLSEVLASHPAWWTAIVKAKVIAGIALAFRFAHSFGLIHGRLTTKNIVFDSNHRLQISDFVSGLSGRSIHSFSNAGWHPEIDVRGFVSLLFEIAICRPANGEVPISNDILCFDSKMIGMGLSRKARMLPSFRDVFETRKQPDYRIMPLC